MANPQPMLGPVIALVAWTALMWGWMYATRIPAILRLRMRLDGNLPRGEQMATLPPRVRWKADNYNHLLEQPILFYAVGLSLAVLGDASTVSLALAWTYVALRVVHSLWQALVNVIPVRFALFAVSSLVLFALVVRAALQVF
ncbi:MAPEG family protein [Thermomonas carbonis]|uniref:MAPEG family protein n=1 Tax=Thermomonas carbonis TaxID=1463158 RepID=A0A7G9STV6_9GAMM|nr:MAPEG family protein [Thermomonas carbonis]QNN71281.1 MAPEG family protein [Thermomonas carbonis]GHC10665.1 membrane protein [Thermomonas carbonis]